MLSSLEERIVEFQELVWALYTPTGVDKPPCLRCHKPGVTLHEIIPRSIDRMWYTKPWNSVVLCNECHFWAGGAGEAGRAELRRLRDNLPNTKEDKDFIRELISDASGVG